MPADDAAFRPLLVHTDDRKADDIANARAFFSAGDGERELLRIWDAGYISQAAYDELSEELDYYGRLLTPAEAV